VGTRKSLNLENNLAEPALAVSRLLRYFLSYFWSSTLQLWAFKKKLTLQLWAFKKKLKRTNYG